MAVDLPKKESDVCTFPKRKVAVGARISFLVFGQQKNMDVVLVEPSKGKAKACAQAHCLPCCIHHVSNKPFNHTLAPQKKKSENDSVRVLHLGFILFPVLRLCVCVCVCCVVCWVCWMLLCVGCCVLCVLCVLCALPLKNGQANTALYFEPLVEKEEPPSNEQQHGACNSQPL